MTNTVKSLLWAFAGTAVSVIGGFAAFFVLAFVLGPGIDIDNKGTPIQKFFDAAALPSLYFIPFVGTFLSWVLTFTIFRR